jgi:hypothetical protein
LEIHTLTAGSLLFLTPVFKKHRTFGKAVIPAEAGIHSSPFHGAVSLLRVENAPAMTKYCPKRVYSEFIAFIG